MKTKNYFFKTTTLIGCFILLCVSPSYAQNIIAEWLPLNSATQPVWTQKTGANPVYMYRSPTRKSTNNEFVEFRCVDIGTESTITYRPNKINQLGAEGSPNVGPAPSNVFKYGLMFVNNFAQNDYFTTTISTDQFTSIKVNTFFLGNINMGDPNSVFTLSYVKPGQNEVIVASYTFTAKNKVMEYETTLPVDCEGVNGLELRWKQSTVGLNLLISNPAIAVSITGAGGYPELTTALQTTSTVSDISTKDGKVYVTSKEVQDLPIYNIHGQVVSVVKLHVGLNEIKLSNKGIYILCGKKIVV